MNEFPSEEWVKWSNMRFQFIIRVLRKQKDYDRYSFYRILERHVM